MKNMFIVAISLCFLFAAAACSPKVRVKNGTGATYVSDPNLEFSINNSEDLFPLMDGLSAGEMTAYVSCNIGAARCTKFLDYNGDTYSCDKEITNDNGTQLRLKMLNRYTYTIYDDGGNISEDISSVSGYMSEDTVTSPLD